MTDSLATYELDGEVALRPRDPGVHLRYTRAEIVAFIEGVQDNEFDDLLAES